MSDTTAAADGASPAPAGGGAEASGASSPLPNLASGFGSGLNVSEILGMARRADIALAVGVITILVILILPLPAMALDVFLAISIISY